MAKSSSKLTQFVRGAVILTISNLLIKAANFFLLPLYTAYLTPEELGITDSITSFSAIMLPLLVVAFDSAFGAFFYEEDNAAYRSRVFNTTFFFLLGMSMLALVPILFARPLSVLLFKTEAYAAAITVSMVSVAVNMWFLPFSLQVRMENRMTLFSILSFVASLSMLAFNIYLVTVLKLGYLALILSTLFVHILQLILFAAFGKASIRISLFDRALFGRMLRYALPCVPVVLAGWVLSLSDRYILLFYSGEAVVGIYGIGTRFVNVLSLVTGAVYTAFSPFAFSSNKDDNAQTQYVFVQDIVHILLLGIAGTVSVFGKEILHLMVDESYFSASLLLGPLLLGQVCYAANTIMCYGFAFAKRSVYNLVTTLSGAVLNVLLNFLLIPRFGAPAAAYTTLLGYFVMAALTFFLSQRVYVCRYHFGKFTVSLLLGVLATVASYSLGLAARAGLYTACVALILYLYRRTLSDLLTRVCRQRGKETAQGGSRIGDDGRQEAGKDLHPADESEDHMS